MVGLARAKAEGKQLGRPTGGVDQEKNRVLRPTGIGTQRMAKIIGAGTSTVQRMVASR